MQEILRTNDPVHLSWAQSILEDAGIPTLVFDQHAAVIEGSINAIQRRLMVADADTDRARQVLEAADDTVHTQ